MKRKEHPIYEFGPFRVDTAERLLLRRGRAVALSPKVFDTLLVLVENSGRTLEKSELMQTLWPENFVEESSLTQNIFQLRKALEDGAGGQYIETVAKRGLSLRRRRQGVWCWRREPRHITPCRRE